MVDKLLNELLRMCESIVWLKGLLLLMTLDLDDLLAVQPSQFPPFDSSIVYVLYSCSCGAYSGLLFYCTFSFTEI